MIKNIFFIVVVGVVALHAEVYYAKIEPYQMKKISSNVTGEVLMINEDVVGKKLGKNPFIKIDDQLDKAEYEQVKNKKVYIKKIIESNEEILKNLFEILEKKNKNYEKVVSLKMRSQVQKDQEYYDLLASKNQLLATQKEIENLKMQLADLNLREKQLKKILKDKSVTCNGCVLYTLDVKEGQVVSPGMKLAEVADTSRALLTFYVDAEELTNIQNKVVYLDGIKTPYKVSRVLDIADKKNISKYMVQVITKAPKVFSKLVKIELKEK